MKKLGLPDRADVNPPPPSVLVLSIIASSLGRKKEDRKCLPSPSPALLSCKALGPFWLRASGAPAQTLLGTDRRDEVGHISLPKGRSLQGMSEQGMGLLGHSRAWMA